MVDERAPLATAAGAEPAMDGAMLLASLSTPGMAYGNSSSNSNSGRSTPSTTVPASPASSRTPVSKTLNSISLLKSLVGVSDMSAANGGGGGGAAAGGGGQQGDYTDAVPFTLVTLVAQLSGRAQGPGSGAGDWQALLSNRVATVGMKFNAAFSKQSGVGGGGGGGGGGAQQDDTARQVVAGERFRVATGFYYKALESIVEHEIKPRPGYKGLMGLLHSDLFNESLLACSIEIVLFAYEANGRTSNVAFPWVLGAVGGLCPFEFQKVIEIVIRSESGLSSAIIKHLSNCERTVLERLAWSETSSVHAHLALPTHGIAGGGGRKSSAVQIFFRKVFGLAKLRLEDLCAKLRIPKDVGVLMSTCLRHAIESQHSRLLVGRHIDQLIMASMHAVWIVSSSTRPANQQNLSFSRMIQEYRKQPQADPKVCYEIPLGEETATGAGRATGDIVAFYNGVFVPVLEPFIRSLSADQDAAAATDLNVAAGVTFAGVARIAAAAPALPLPDRKIKRVHSPRRVGRNTSLTVSPISASRRAASQSPQGSPTAKQNISYAFHHSPSKNLDVINKHLKGQAADQRIPGKKSARSNDDDDDGEDNGGVSGKRRMLNKPRVLVDNKFIAATKTLPEDAAMLGSPLKRAYTAKRIVKSSAPPPQMVLDDVPNALPAVAGGERAAPAVVSEVPIRTELGVSPLAASPPKQLKAGATAAE